MADIIALQQDDNEQSWEFINADNAMRFCFYVTDPAYNDYSAYMICRVTRLPIGPYDEDNITDEEKTIPIAFDDNALTLLNNFRRRCGLGEIALDDADTDEAAD